MIHNNNVVSNQLENRKLMATKSQVEPSQTLSNFSILKGPTKRTQPIFSTPRPDSAASYFPESHQYIDPEPYSPPNLTSQPVLNHDNSSIMVTEVTQRVSEFSFSHDKVLAPEEGTDSPLEHSPNNDVPFHNRRDSSTSSTSRKVSDPAYKSHSKETGSSASLGKLPPNLADETALKDNYSESVVLPDIDQPRSERNPSDPTSITPSSQSPEAAPSVSQHSSSHYSSSAPRTYSDMSPSDGTSAHQMTTRSYTGSESVPCDLSQLPNESTQKIPTKEALETYRQNAKKSPDPEVHLDFAKYLVETAALVLENRDNQVDSQTARKLHNTLLTEALKWIKRLANQGTGIGKGAYPEAQFFLATCYNNGSLGLPVDHDKAFHLYAQASKQNHSAATYRTGVCYEFGAGTKRDQHRALQFFRKAAALGDTAAMFKVGMALLRGGLGQQANPREGITWLKRAADSADEENPHALHELGSCYEKGGISSIIADEAYSRELYTQAAQLGYVHSQFKLGVCYEQGLLTCPVDPRRSIAWFTRGAEKGDPECELALSGWYLTGSEDILQQSDTEAYLWARKAADKGLAKAEYAVGYYSEVGIGATQSMDEARRWYMRAAAQGNRRAMERLAELKQLEGGRKGGSKSKEDKCVIS